MYDTRAVHDTAAPAILAFDGYPPTLRKNTEVFASIYGHLCGYSGTRFTAATYSYNNRVPVEQPGTRVPGAQILGEYDMFPVPVTGIRKPGNIRVYRGHWQKEHSMV